ncbi:hypothetical protein QQP08_023788 [Theobroma cacao]|nr:hypothetical protein QQP08_023788 [Theobroma cacao]
MSLFLSETSYIQNVGKISWLSMVSVIFIQQSHHIRFSEIKIFQLACGPSPVSCSACTHPNAVAIS